MPARSTASGCSALKICDVPFFPCYGFNLHLFYSEEALPSPDV
jgi:hypothetical protein